MAEQKKSPSTNGEFKTSPLGFDKAEVMAYIVQHNKERKALKEENDELKRALEEKQQTNEGQNNELTAELEKKKAAADEKIAAELNRKKAEDIVANALASGMTAEEIAESGSLFGGGADPVSPPVRTNAANRA